MSVFEPRLVALAVTVVLTAACGGNGPTTPTPNTGSSPSSPAGFTLEIWTAEAARWASSGAYDYDVTYRFHNTTGQQATATITDAVLIGPAGETLSRGLSPSSAALAETVGAGLYSSYRRVSLDDNDVSHPFGEQLRLMASVTVGGSSRTIEAVSPVLHGPQTARLIEFAVSPLQPTLGQTITIRWNVQSARKVVLRTPIAWDSNNSSTYQYNVDGEVEAVGSRTLTVRRSYSWVELEVDQSLIRRSIDISARQ